MSGISSKDAARIKMDMRASNAASRTLFDTKPCQKATAAFNSEPKGAGGCEPKGAGAKPRMRIDKKAVNTASRLSCDTLPVQKGAGGCAAAAKADAQSRSTAAFHYERKGAGGCAAAAEAEAQSRYSRFCAIDQDYKKLHTSWLSIDSDLKKFWKLKEEDENASFLPSLDAFYREARLVCDAYQISSVPIVSECRKIVAQIEDETVARSPEAHKKKLAKIMGAVFTKLDSRRKGV